MADVAASMYRQRSLARWLGMRRTLFLVPREDVSLVQAAASGPVVAALRTQLIRKESCEALAWRADIVARPCDNRGLTRTTAGCQDAPMDLGNANEDRAKFQRLIELRTAALEHARLARELSAQRRAAIIELMEAGYSQSDIAREMGVTRQAVQKMLAAG